MAQWNRAGLSDILEERLTLDEAQEAAFDLGYEDAEGRTKSQLIRALLEYLDDRQQLDRIIAWLTKNRPDINTAQFALAPPPSPPPTPHVEPPANLPDLTRRPLGIALMAALILVLAGGLWSLMGARGGGRAAPTPAQPSPTPGPVVAAATSTPSAPTASPSAIPSTPVGVGSGQDRVKVHLVLSRVWIVGVDPRPQPIAEASAEGPGDQVHLVVNQAYRALNPAFRAPTPMPLPAKVQVDKDGAVTVDPPNIQVVAYALTNGNSPSQRSLPPEVLTRVAPEDARPQYLELLAEGYAPGYVELPRPLELPFTGQATLVAPAKQGVALAKPTDISITPSSRQYGPVLLATLTELLTMDVGRQWVVQPSDFQQRLDRLAADIARFQNSPPVKTSLRANLGVTYLIETEFSVMSAP